jgi:anti-anti-sigma regulatory factor
MGLRWKKISHQGEYINSEIDITKKKQFAQDLLETIKNRKIIINFDESIIKGTTS